MSFVVFHNQFTDSRVMTSLHCRTRIGAYYRFCKLKRQRFKIVKLVEFNLQGDTHVLKYYNEKYESTVNELAQL